MKRLLQQYATYNVWANQKLVNCIEPLEEELLNKELPSSFKTIHLTLLHIWDAESIWWQRIKLQEAITAPSANFKGTAKDVAAAMMHQNRLWETWVQNATEAALEHVFHYHNSKREQFKQPIYQAVMQVFNHGTYHRGQLVNMLRQLGIEKIPPTDLIIFFRTAKVKL